MFYFKKTICNANLFETLCDLHKDKLVPANEPVINRLLHKKVVNISNFS